MVTMDLCVGNVAMIYLLGILCKEVQNVLPAMRIYIRAKIVFFILREAIMTAMKRFLTPYMTKKGLTFAKVLK